MSQLYKMKLGDCEDIITDKRSVNTIKVTRVPGGWIYWTNNGLFVPFNNEFQEEPPKHIKEQSDSSQAVQQLKAKILAKRKGNICKDEGLYGNGYDDALNWILQELAAVE